MFAVLFSCYSANDSDRMHAMKRPLFCELCPLAFRLSRLKGILLRKLKDALSRQHFCKEKAPQPLAHSVAQHASLIRRKLEGVNEELQNNKAKNLALAAPCINGILIRPGETFSLWRLIGNTTARKGYLPGLVIACGKPTAGVGGGMCQLSNLLHWMVLHSALTITEHHHHERFNLFPDDRRQVPFGLGTSIVYNYLDYRVTNNTTRTYQFLLSTDGEYLRGELRADAPESQSYCVKVEKDDFIQEEDGIYRCCDIYREVTQSNGETRTEHLLSTHARVMYDIPADTPLH